MNEQTPAKTGLTDASFLSLSTSARRTYALLLSHEYMKLDKVCERAAEADPTLRRGQIDGGLKVLRDAGWAKWARCTEGNKLKWKRCEERLLTPMEPSVRRNRKPKPTAAGLSPPPEQATMRQLIDNMAVQLGYIEAGLKQARFDLATMKTRLKLFQ